MKKNNLPKLNSLIEKKLVNKNGKTFVNLILSVQLNNGSVVCFEIQPKFYNSKFDFMLKSNIDEAK